jgi:hypothetical protein
MRELDGYLKLCEELGVKDEYLSNKESIRRDLVAMLNTSSFIILTAQNPMSKKADKETNELLNAKLENILISKHLRFEKVIGKYGNKEQSFLVYNINRSEAVKLCKEFNQESIFSSDEGLINSDGEVINSIDSEDEILISDSLNDNYTEMNYKGLNFRFQIPLN